MNFDRPFPKSITAPREFKSRSRIDELRIETTGLALGRALASADQSNSRLIVEIGCGVGWHPIQMATENSQDKIVAIERTSEKYRRFAQRLHRHPELLERVCAVHSDAIHFIDQYFLEQTIDQCWILYPNPELKRPNLRWFRTPFIHRLCRSLKSGGTIHLATNLSEYADECRQLAPALGLRIVLDETFNKTTKPNFNSRTHFEKKYFDRGEQLHDFVFEYDRGNK